MFTRIVCAMSCMLVLLLSPAAALNGAAYGLALWYRTLFPTLMPFMVLSNFIVYTGCAKPIGVLLAPLTKLLHLPAAHKSYKNAVPGSGRQMQQLPGTAFL